MNKNGLHRLIYVKIWFLVIGICKKDYELSYPLVMGFKLSKANTRLHLHLYLHFANQVKVLSYRSLAMPACPPWYPWIKQPSRTLSKPPIIWAFSYKLPMSWCLFTEVVQELRQTLWKKDELGNEEIVSIINYLSAIMGDVKKSLNI